MKPHYSVFHKDSELPPRGGFGLTQRLGASLCWAVFAFALALAGTVRGAALPVAPLHDIGAAPPTIGVYDIAQTNVPATFGGPGGLNYYFDNSVPPGQVFTTGSNPFGYTLVTLAVKTSGNLWSSLPSGGQAYYLRLYSVTGTTATFITNYPSTSNFTYTDLDWMQWSNLSVKVVPNAAYAYSFSRLPGGSGYECMASVAGNPYAGGLCCLIPTNGGTINYGTTNTSCATFTVGLSAITSQSVTVSNWVLDTANYTLGNTNSNISIKGEDTTVVTITNTNSADQGGALDNLFLHSAFSPKLGLTNVGDSITMAGSVILRGSVAGNQQFHLGLFQQGTNASDTNWLGYFFENANTATAGNANFDAMQSPNTGLYASDAAATILASPAVTGGASYGAGTYKASIVVTLLASNLESLAWTFTNGTYTQTGSVTNTNSSTAPLTFDTVGMMAGSSFGGKAVTFSNLAVTYSVAPPGITINPEPISETVALGQPASFNVAATGSGPLGFQWYTCSDTNYDNPSPLPGATNNIYSIASTVATNSTNYFVVVTNSTQTATSTIAILTVRLTVNNLAWLGSAGANWDTVTANWSNTATFASPVDYIPGDMVNFTDSGVSSTAIIVVGTINPDSITDSSASNYTIGTGVLAGGTGITKTGTGTLIMNGANTFTGTVAVNNGVVQLGNVSALGASSALVSVNGGTVDIHSVQGPVNSEFMVQGNGYTGGTNLGGCIDNLGTGNSQNGNGIAGLVLAGDAVVATTVSRWDINGDAAGGAKLQGNHHSLTKIGAANQLWMVDAGTNNGLSNITINAGTLGFQGIIDLGDAAGTLTVNSNAVLGFYNCPTNIVMNKTIVLSNGAISDSISNITLLGPVTLLSTNNLPNPASTITLTFNGPVSGTGGLTIAAAGSVVLNGTNTYTGPTYVNSGTLTLGANSGLKSSLIQLAGGASLSANSLALGAGQTLDGGAGATISSATATITNSAGSTIGAGIGGAPGYLSVGNGSTGLTMSSATNIISLGATPSDTTGATSSYIYTAGPLVLSGVNTFLIVPNATLSTASPYTVMEADSGITGTLANIHAITTNPRLTATPILSSPYIEISIAGAAGQLVWKGGVAGNPTAWDHSTTNWFNTVSSALDVFYDGDVVTFDDTAHTNVVAMAQTVTPGNCTFNNNSLSYTLAGVGSLAGTTLNLNGTQSVTIANSNANSVANVNFNNASGTPLIFNQPLNTTFAGAFSDLDIGLSSVTKTGSNTLVLTGNNVNFFSPISVTNGVLQYTTNVALGSATYFYATNGGSLDIDNVDAGTVTTLAISGAGYNGQGAIMNSAGVFPAIPYQIVHNLLLLNDATIGCNARWDMGPTDVLTGNGYNLTKVGPGQDWLLCSGNINVNNIHIVAGEIGFQQLCTMGIATGTVTVESNAALGFWAQSNILNKVAVFNPGASVASGGSSNEFAGPITLNGPGSTTFATAVDLQLDGPISGAGGLSRSGGNNLWLEGTNTYTGYTLVGGNSTIIVGANSSMSGTTNIEVDGGSTLNVTTPASFNLGAGQTMNGNGTVIGGTINFNSGSTLAEGFGGSTYTMTMNGTLNLNAGSTNRITINKGTTNVVPSDLVSGLTTVHMGGTLVITNLGSALANGDAIQIFSATNYTGGFSAIIPAAPPGAGLSWNTSSLVTNGTLLVVGSALPSTPTNIMVGLTNGQLTLSWPSSYTGWYLQVQTNPLNVGISNNWYIVAGASNTNSVIVSLNTTNGAVFYRMLYP